MAREREGADKNDSWARFQKLGGGGFSEGHWELNSQNELNSGGLPCFSGNVLFLWQHCYQLLTSLCIF